MPARSFVVVVCSFFCAVSSAGCRNDIVGSGEGEGEGEGDDGGAGEGEGDDCPDEERPAISLRVHDQQTDVVLCDAAVSVVDGDFAADLDAAFAAPDCRYVGPLDRPGTYALTVVRAGYQTFENPAVVVDADACGDPFTRELDFGLVPD